MVLKNIGASKLILVVAGIVAAANAASAANVTYTYAGETGGGVDMGIHIAAGTVDSRIGQYILTTADPGFNASLLSYCTDVGMYLANSFTYTPTPLSAATGVSPAWLPGGIQNAATLWFNDRAAATTATQTAGLQLAIWELLYNPVFASYSLATLESHSNGGFYVTTTDADSTAAMNYAVDALNNFKNLAPEVDQVEWLAPTSPDGALGDYQGLLYPLAGPLPAPDAVSTLGLLGAAVIALGLASRKLSVAKA